MRVLLIVGFLMAALYVTPSYADARTSACMDGALAACKQKSRSSEAYFSCAEAAVKECGIRGGGKRDFSKRIAEAASDAEAKKFEETYLGLLEDEGAVPKNWGLTDISAGPTSAEACKCHGICQFVSFTGHNYLYHGEAIAENAQTCKLKTENYCAKGWASYYYSSKCDPIPDP